MKYNTYVINDIKKIICNYYPQTIQICVPFRPFSKREIHESKQGEWSQTDHCTIYVNQKHLSEFVIEETNI